jgi:hypothetical protein
MRAKITLAMAMFIGFVLYSVAVAYYPVLIVRECPHCKAHVVQEDTLSGNTIGAIYWTDGKREAKMLPDHPALVRCPACAKLFWVEEAAQVGLGFEVAKGKPQVLAPSEKEMMDALARPGLSGDKEIYLRMHAWWKANDAWRWVPNSKPAFSREQVQSLHALTALLDESEPGQRILKAEIARELGNFDECLLLLSNQFDEDYDHAVGFIKKLTEEKVQGVRAFSRGK